MGEGIRDQAVVSALIGDAFSAASKRGANLLELHDAANAVAKSCAREITERVAAGSLGALVPFETREGAIALREVGEGEPEGE